jgi:hypothetical protein
VSDPFLTALVEWLNVIAPPGLQLEVDEVSDEYVEVSGHGFGLSPDVRLSPVETARCLAYLLLDAVQDDIVEEHSWGTPWPAQPDGHELPRAQVEVHPDGVTVGYVDTTGWVARSPMLPLPVRWIDQSPSG